MADVADGRLWPDARPGAPFPAGRQRAGPPLRARTLHEGDAPAVRRLRQGLGEAPYAAGNDVSIADFAILGWAWRHERHQVDLADYPNVKRWYEAMMARPGTKRGFEVTLS